MRNQRRGWDHPLEECRAALVRRQERSSGGAVIGAGLFALMISLFTATPGTARPGAYIGVGTVFNDIGGNIDPAKLTASGSGPGVKGGFGVGAYVSLEASYWITKHDREGGLPLELEGITGDVKVEFPITDSHVEPYLLAGIGRYMLDTTRGSGWHYGVGMDIYLFPSVSFNTGLTRRIVDIGTATRVSGTVTSMEFGFAYHFP